jgi:hypothetical protein
MAGGENPLASANDSDPKGKKNLKSQHVLIAIGVITLIVIVILGRKSSSSSTDSSTIAADESDAAAAQAAQDAQTYAAQTQGAGTTSTEGIDDPYADELIQYLTNQANANGNNTNNTTPPPTTTTPSTQPASNSSPTTETYGGNTWTEIITAANDPEWIDGVGDYFYGTQAPNANDPYGTDINGTPLTGPGAWLKQPGSVAATTAAKS